MLQRKLVQAYFFFSMIHALGADIRPEAASPEAASEARQPLEVLDIGFGTGFLGSLLSQAGIRYTGFDLSEVAAEDSAAMNPAGTYLVRNVVETPAPASDVIIASEVLFHIVDDAQWLRAIANIAAGMRPASVFMFTETFVDDVRPGPVHFKPRPKAMYAEALAAQGMRFMRPGELRLAAMPVFSGYVPFQRSVHFVRRTN